jgi:hypothetical protein
MRWYSRKHKTNDVRIVTRFLFLPKQIGKQKRWFEFAAIFQKLQDNGKWLDTNWANSGSFSLYIKNRNIQRDQWSKHNYEEFKTTS